jgi:hypothetical protein
MEYGHPAPLHARVAILYLAASNQGLYAKRLIHPFVIHASPIERYGSAVLSVPYESYSICGSFIYNRIYLFPVDLFSLSGTFPKLSVYLCGSNGPDCPTVRFCLFIICVGYFIQQDRLEIVKISKFQSTIFSCSLASKTQHKVRLPNILCSGLMSFLLKPERKHVGLLAHRCTLSFTSRY